jgi:hypothetical protein
MSRCYKAAPTKYRVSDLFDLILLHAAFSALLLMEIVTYSRCRW